MKYQIVEGSYIDEFGKEVRKVYTIRRRKTLLGIKYWSTVTHEECGWGDCYKRPTEFKTRSDAHEFILNVLCEGGKRDGWSYKVVSEFDCTYEKK